MWNSGHFSEQANRGIIEYMLQSSSLYLLIRFLYMLYTDPVFKPKSSGQIVASYPFLGSFSKVGLEIFQIFSANCRYVTWVYFL